MPLEDIAKEAGVSIGTLYNRFPTRGELVEAALADKVASAVDLAEKALVLTIIGNARKSGQLRADFEEGDFAFVLWSTATIINATAATAPGAWRRHLAILLDGLRADAANPLPRRALEPAEVAEAMRTLGG